LKVLKKNIASTNQYQKLVANKRTQYLGLIRITLENPNLIIKDVDGANIYIKSFIDKNGALNFANVTVEKDNLNISISSHPIKNSKLKRLLKQGKLLHNTLGYATSDHTSSATNAPSNSSLAGSPNKNVPQSGENSNKNDQNQEPNQADQTLTTSDKASGIVLQNRDRSSAASIAQMAAIAANPDYLSVGQSNSMSDGAPIVFGNLPKTALLGKSQKIKDGKNRRYNVVYAVLEAVNIRPSNNADGTSIKEYVNNEDGILRVIVGNGRAAGVIAAYHKGTAAGYRAELLEDLSENLGFSTAAVAKIEQMTAPILVRLIDEQDMPPDIADASNISQTANLSPLEQAINDGARLDITKFAFDENGEPTFDTVKMFINAMPTSERANLLNPDGSPTRQGKERILAATFNKAYGNEELVRIFAQAEDLEAVNIIKSLVKVAGNMAKLDEGGGLILRQTLAKAAVGAINARRRGMSLKEYAAQGNIFRDKKELEILKFFAENIKSGKKMAEKLQEATFKALDNLERVKIEVYQKTMFGKTELLTFEDLLTSLFKEIKNLF